MQQLVLPSTSTVSCLHPLLEPLRRKSGLPLPGLRPESLLRLLAHGGAAQPVRLPLRGDPAERPPALVVRADGELDLCPRDPGRADLRGAVPVGEARRAGRRLARRVGGTSGVTAVGLGVGWVGALRNWSPGTSDVGSASRTRRREDVSARESRDRIAQTGEGVVR